MATSQTQIMAHPLYEGTFSVGLDKNFNRIDRSDPPEKGALKISVNPFLIQSGDKSILFDAGIGDFAEDTSTDIIKDNIAKYGLTEYDITDIFTSHLHYDHLCGLAGRSSGYWEMTFPNAKLWVSRKGWEEITSKDEYYDEEKTAFIHFIDAKADLHFLEDGDQPYEEIKVETIGGHTKYSQALYFDDGSQRYLMAGDVLANRGEVNRKFAAKYDYDAKQSMQKRKELTRYAYEEEYIVMGYHDSHHPLFKLTDFDEQQGYKISPIT